MSRSFPALDLAWPAGPADDEVDRAIAELDGHAPTAVEPQPRGIRVFFQTEDARNAAAAHVASALPSIALTMLLVPDDDWAERSQASVIPIRIGRIIVTPPWAHAGSDPEALVIVIEPSMGFGTGHHASTRLCLGLLQEEPIAGRAAIDVGTGSGVLALAAARLGAARVTAIDYDEDALTSARENVARNDAAGCVTLQAVDIARGPVALAPADLVLGNLTGALLVREAARLVALVTPGGALIASGFLAHERDDVVAAFAACGAAIERERGEDEWAAGLFRRPATASPSASTT
jgi:ribosomal protein L11 methyltransferase